jgi:hypothetical protein
VASLSAPSSLISVSTSCPHAPAASARKDKPLLVCRRRPGLRERRSTTWESFFSRVAATLVYVCLFAPQTSKESVLHSQQASHSINIHPLSSCPALGRSRLNDFYWLSHQLFTTHCIPYYLHHLPTLYHHLSLFLSASASLLSISYSNKLVFGGFTASVSKLGSHHLFCCGLTGKT